MGNVSSHTYTYAGKRSFACNCEENNGKCGLAPPNNRFERTHGTSPFAAQPNVMSTPSKFSCKSPALSTYSTDIPFRIRHAAPMHTRTEPRIRILRLTLALVVSLPSELSFSVISLPPKINCSSERSKV